MIISSTNSLIPQEPGIKDPFLAKLMYAERRMGIGTQSYSSRAGYTEVPEEYRPQSQTPYFPITAIEVPKELATITLANPSRDLFERYVQDHTVSFCVHPVALAKQKKHIVELLKKHPLWTAAAVPSASSRTVCVLDSTTTTHALKCHLPVQISSLKRGLFQRTIQHSVTISQILGQTDIAHLPETIGISVQEEDGSPGWGFIVRELTPRPSLPGKRTLIPCFSLYGKDMNHPSEPPLIVKLIQMGNKDPKKYVLEHVMFPIIDDFAKALNTQGVLLEAHGQNTLIEFDERMESTRIIHRDLDNYVDGKTRTARGLSFEGISKYHIFEEPTETEPFGSVPSLIYDGSIGSCHFDFLADILEEYFGIPSLELQKECQARFQEKIPDYRRIFSDTLYTYGNPNPYPLVPRINQGPIWRPLCVTASTKDDPDSL